MREHEEEEGEGEGEGVEEMQGDGPGKLSASHGLLRPGRSWAKRGKISEDTTVVRIGAPRPACLGWKPASAAGGCVAGAEILGLSGALSPHL